LNTSTPPPGHSLIVFDLLRRNFTSICRRCVIPKRHIEYLNNFFGYYFLHPLCKTALNGILPCCYHEINHGGWQ